MAGSIDRVSINGNMYSWGSVSVFCDGLPLIGVCGVKYSDKRERVKAYGTGRHHAPRGRSRGKYSAEGSLTLWKDTAADLRIYLASRSGTGSYGDTEFQLSVQFFENDTDLHDVQLVRACIAGSDTSADENPDPLKEEIPLDIIAIIRDGVTLFDNTDAGIAGIVGQVAGALGSAANALGF